MLDRTGLVIALVEQEDMSNAAYIRGEIDRDTWTQQLQDIDTRLTIAGLRLANRPWNGAEPSPVVPSQPRF